MRKFIASTFAALSLGSAVEGCEKEPVKSVEQTVETPQFKPRNDQELYDKVQEALKKPHQEVVSTNSENPLTSEEKEQISKLRVKRDTTIWDLRTKRDAMISALRKNREEAIANLRAQRDAKQITDDHFFLEKDRLENDFFAEKDRLENDFFAEKDRLENEFFATPLFIKESGQKKRAHLIKN